MKPIWAVLSLTAISGAANASNLVVNGGFETGDLTGWTVTGDTPSITGGHSGAYGLILSLSSDPTVISQVLTTQVGQEYSLSLWGAGQGYRQPTAPIYFSVGGSPSAFYLPSDVQWHQRATSFIASSTTTEISFSGRQGDLLYLDDITVEAVPEPFTLAAFAFGLAAFSRRRR